MSAVYVIFVHVIVHELIKSNESLLIFMIPLNLLLKSSQLQAVTSRFDQSIMC